jgi:DNA-binding response OmpR family regulator
MAGFELIRRFFGNEPGERRTVPRSGLPRGAWVLVVDDSATIRAVLGKMLSQDGHVVLKAPDGETAIEMARTEKPDLIFLDIVMPGMNGFAVLRALRREPQTHDIPIVMISGNLQATEQFYVQRFGADDFMKKPFGRSEVFARIQHLTKSGRLVTRERTPEDLLPAVPEHTEAEHAAIPDIAMPDPHDMLVPPAESS